MKADYNFSGIKTKSVFVKNRNQRKIQSNKFRELNMVWVRYAIVIKQTCGSILIDKK